MDNCHIVYDFSVMPITFDGMVALCCAASIPKKEGLKASIHFVRDTYRAQTPRDRTYDDHTKKWRSTNILLRGAGLINNVSQITVTDHRSMEFNTKALIPPEWRANKPVPLGYTWKTMRALHESGYDFRLLRSGIQAKRHIKNYLSTTKSNVSLSVRSADYDSSRNTNIDDWVGLYNYLESAGYHCIIVPDQSSALSGEILPFPPERVMTSAAIDLELRLALYESCYGNIGWSGGQCSIQWLSRVSFLIFGALNSNSPIADKRYWRDYGFSIKENNPLFLNNQFYDWKDAKRITLDHLIEKSCLYLKSLEVTPTSNSIINKLISKYRTI